MLAWPGYSSASPRGCWPRWNARRKGDVVSLACCDNAKERSVDGWPRCEEESTAGPVASRMGPPWGMHHTNKTILQASIDPLSGVSTLGRESSEPTPADDYR